MDHSKGHVLKNADGSIKTEKNGNPIMGAGHIQTEGVGGLNFAGSQGVLNSIVGGIAVGLDAVGGTLETVGDGLMQVEEKFPRTMQILDPIGTIHEHMVAPSQHECGDCMS